MTPIAAVEPVVRNRPPPETAVVSDPNGVRAEDSGMAQQDAVVEGAEQAGPPVPSLGIPGPATPGMDEFQEVSAAEMDMDETVEPDAKRQRLSMMRVDDETLYHMDVNGDEYLNDLPDV